MLIASPSLARRIERAESALITAWGQRAAARLGESQVIVAPIGGGAAVMPGPGSALSKVSGLGFEPLSASDLETIERRFAAFETPVRVELSSLGDPGVGKLLSERGYVLSGFENVLGLPIHASHSRPAAARNTTITIEEVAATDAGIWADVVATGFMHADVVNGPAPEVPDRTKLDLVFNDIARIDGFSQYLARRDGHPAGGASMRIHDGVAQFCGAATLPEHRRLGIQSALLQERLAHAARAGCDVAIVTTEPGSMSQQNAQRQGFELLYVRAVMRRGWGGRD
jgi:ribosomal protein S18 acetylase RimI-like enzyme